MHNNIVEIYKKQSRRKGERNNLVLVNTPGKTDRGDSGYLQKDKTRGGSRKNNDLFSKQRKSFHGVRGHASPGMF